METLIRRVVGQDTFATELFNLAEFHQRDNHDHTSSNEHSALLNSNSAELSSAGMRASSEHFVVEMRDGHGLLDTNMLHPRVQQLGSGAAFS